MRRLCSTLALSAVLFACVQAQGPVLAWDHTGPVNNFRVKIDAQPMINIGLPDRDTNGRYVWALPSSLSAAAHSFIIEACNVIAVCVPSVTLKVPAQTSKPIVPTNLKFEQTTTGQLGTGIPRGTAVGQGPPGGGSLPDVPTSPSPVNQATGIGIQPTLTFAAQGTSYAVYFGTVNPPTSRTVLESPSYPPGTLAFSTTYYWIGEACNAVGCRQSPGVWSFTTADAPSSPPSNIQAVFPANGGTGVSVNPTLTCSATDATSYEVRIDTVNPPVSAYTSVGSTCSYTPSPRANLTPYYWQVRATGPGGTTSSSVFSFTTVAEGSSSFIANNPRLILTSAKLAELVSRKNSNTADYLQFKAFMDTNGPTDNSNTTLTSAITSTQGAGTTFTVSNCTGFPGTDHTVRINTEGFHVTCSGGTVTIVSRNQDLVGAGGGEQTAHAIGATMWRHTTHPNYFQVAVGAALMHQLGVAGYDDMARNALNLVMHIFSGFSFYQTLNRPHWSGGELAVAYDWTHDILTADEKLSYAALTHTLIQYYAGAMDEYYFTPQVGDQRSFWEQHATMNVTAGVIRFVEMTSAAAADDDADAIDHWNKALDWIGYVRTALLGGATHGGINAEGSEYSQTDWIIYQEIFASLASATDTPSELSDIAPWIARFVKATAYLMTPGASNSLATTLCSGSVGSVTMTCGDLSSFTVGENVTQTLDLGAGSIAIDAVNRAKVTPTGWTPAAGDVGKAIFIQFYDQHWRFWISAIDGDAWILERALPTTFGDVDFAYDVTSPLNWAFGGNSGYSPFSGALWKTAVIGKSGTTLTIRDPLPNTVTNQSLTHLWTMMPFSDTETLMNYDDYNSFNGELQVALAMAQDTLVDNGETSVAEYAEYILANQLPATISYLRPQWFVWREPGITATNVSALPLAHTTADDLSAFALLFAQSDWTPTRTQLVFLGGGDSGNHVMSQYGSYGLRRKGVWLTRNLAAYGIAHTANTLHRCEFGCGLRLAEVPLVGSRWSNSAQMNGHSGLSNLIENTRNSGPSGFTAVSTVAPTSYAYARMDASNVYSGDTANGKYNWASATGGLASNNARKWWRDLMYINPDVVFIRDRNTYSAATTSPTRWHFQFRCDDPTVAGQRVTCTYAGQTIVQDILRPSSATLTEFNYRTLDGWLDGSRIQVESGVSASEESQVSVIQLGDAGFTPVTPAVLTTTNADVVEIPVNPSCPNACVVGAARGDGLTFPITYTYSATDPDHRIAGFSPSTVYKVDNNAGTKTVTITTLGAGSNVTADAGGVLVF